MKALLALFIATYSVILSVFIAVAFPLWIAAVWSVPMAGFFATGYRGMIHE